MWSIKIKKLIHPLIILSSTLVMLTACGGGTTPPVVVDTSMDIDEDGIYDYYETYGFYYLDGDFYSLERVMSLGEWDAFAAIDEVTPPDRTDTPFKLAYDTMNDNYFVTHLSNSNVAINFDGLPQILATAFLNEYGETHTFYKSGSNVAGSYKNILRRLNQNYEILEPVSFSGEPLPYYFTDPNVASSDHDPYSDYDEVVDTMIMGNVEYSHPSVAAMPLIQANLISYTITPLAAITDQQGGERGSSSTHSLEKTTSQTEGWRAEATVSTSVSFFPSVEASLTLEANGSYTQGQTISDENTQSESFNWNTATSTETGCAAELLFTVEILNTGSAPASDLNIIYNISVGGAVLESIEPAVELGNLQGASSGVPVSNGAQLTYKVDCISLYQLKNVQLGAELTMTTIVNSSRIPFLDRDSEAWEQYTGMILLSDSRIKYLTFNASDNIYDQTFFIDPENGYKNLTLRDAVKSTLTVKCDSSSIASFCLEADGTIRQSEMTYIGIVPHGSADPSADVNDLLNGSTDLLDIELMPTWEYHIMSTRSVYPTIHSVVLEGNTLKAIATDELGMNTVEVCIDSGACFAMSYSSADQAYEYDISTLPATVGSEYVKATNSRGNSVTNTDVNVPSSWNSVIDVYGGALTTFGSWTSWTMCPENYYAVGFSMQVEADGQIDNTSLNQIALICQEKGTTGSTVRIEDSGNGIWGSWGSIESCDAGEYLQSFDLKSQSYQGLFTDDTAANAVRFKCGNGQQLTADNEGSYGSWLGYKDASDDRYRICGLKVRMEEFQGPSSDDSTLNDVAFRYCAYEEL